MPKRIGTDHHHRNFAPQLKKHIGEMDVNYVYDRQSVYNKTISLLFKGAQNQSKVNSIRKSLDNISISHQNASTKDNFKQMVMNNRCQLETKILLDRSTEVNITQFDKCSFCEKLGCFTSLSQCSKCEEFFCNNCSLSQNSDNDGILCLSCFK